MTDSKWIAYELHDGLMQWIIGARMHVAGLVAAMDEQRSAGDLQANLAQVLTYLNQAAEEGRHLIRFIEGLEEEQQADVVQAIGASCEILSRKIREGQPQLQFRRPTEAWPDLPPPLAWSIVRIVQQAIVNALRHSHGKLVTVDMSSVDNHMRFVVTDDGCGFDPEAERPGHFGLKSMRQRAREAGIDLSIASSSAGSIVTLNVVSP